jgi:hypothetical protein
MRWLPAALLLAGCVPPNEAPLHVRARPEELRGAYARFVASEGLNTGCLDRSRPGVRRCYRLDEGAWWRPPALRLTVVHCPGGTIPCLEAELNDADRTELRALAAKLEAELNRR